MPHMKKSSDAEKDSPTSRRMKARILDAVVPVVAAHGISGTTLARVADRAGVSQGVLVFHFKSKSGLLNATCRHLTEDYLALWQPLIEESDPVARLFGLVRADFHPSVCGQDQLALWFAFWGEANAHEWYDDFCRDVESQRVDIMKTTCRELSGKMGLDNPETLAAAIDGFTDGLWLQMHLRRGVFDREQALEMAMQHLTMLVPSLGDVQAARVPDSVRA